MSNKAKEIAGKIAPVVTPSTQSLSTFEPHPGEYHLMKLDLNGIEVPGSDVSVGPKVFIRTFEKLTKGDKPTYVVKKNPKS